MYLWVLEQMVPHTMSLSSSVETSGGDPHGALPVLSVFCFFFRIVERQQNTRVLSYLMQVEDVFLQSQGFPLCLTSGSVTKYYLLNAMCVSK